MKSAKTPPKSAVMAVLFLSALLVLSLESHAITARANICENAARYAAEQESVPVDVLLAITLVETGRNTDGLLAAWPWTVNWNGEGRWFKGRAEAEAFVANLREAGHKSFDIGCFQINYRWHADAFPSAKSMFDPRQNALYAAQFLKRLNRSRLDWSKAAGAYHSLTPTYAERYRAKFDLARNEFTSFASDAFLSDRRTAEGTQETQQAIAAGSLMPLQAVKTELRPSGSTIRWVH